MMVKTLLLMIGFLGAFGLGTILASLLWAYLTQKRFSGKVDPKKLREDVKRDIKFITGLIAFSTLGLTVAVIIGHSLVLAFLAVIFPIVFAYWGYCIYTDPPEE